MSQLLISRLPLFKGSDSVETSISDRGQKCIFRKSVFERVQKKNNAWQKNKIIKFKSNISIIEIIWNANLMQQVYFIDVFLARHVSGAYAHHQ